jgi:hypothetical protein
MILGRPAESEKDEQKSEASNGKTGDKFDDDFFNKDMIQRKKEFSQRYENFRGRGRWGGYSLVALQDKDTQPKRAPLPVVSTTTATATTTKPSTLVAPTATKSMKQRQQRRQFKRPEPMLQITNIQQYKDEVVDTKDSSLVVVRFYACKYSRPSSCNVFRIAKDVCKLDWIGMLLFFLSSHIISACKRLTSKKRSLVQGLQSNRKQLPSIATGIPFRCEIRGGAPDQRERVYAQRPWHTEPSIRSRVLQRGLCRQQRYRGIIVIVIVSVG